MIGSLPARNSMLGKHVASQITLGLERVAGRTTNCGTFPRLGGLAFGNVAKIRKDLALVTECAHPGMFLHLPFAREEATTVGTVIL